MVKKELAALLGISGAMVSKLAKRGMPTDSLERAQRWRKRHLEPGRMKGQRFDPNEVRPARAAPKAAVLQPPEAASRPDPDECDPVAYANALMVEAAELLEAGQIIDGFLPCVRSALHFVPESERDNVRLAANVMRLLVAHFDVLFPAEETDPCCGDGSPIYDHDMSDSDALKMGMWWYEVAAGEIILNPDWQSPANVDEASA